MDITSKIKSFEIKAKKKYGQHFITNVDILSKIVEKSKINQKINVLEIGPGPGGLTQSLLKANINKLFVIEKDRELIPLLEELKTVYPTKLKIINQDALEFDIKKLNHYPYKIISNLPYNISTALLIKWLKNDICNSSCISFTLMFQKEVADRIVASVGTSKRSRISLLTELYTNPKLVLNIPPGSFVPRPKVSSALIYFEILKKPRYNFDKKKFKIIIDAAFNQKRKMVRSSLKKILPNIASKLTEAGIKETQRPQSIKLKNFCDLSLID